ncbi:hypothetical protein Tco_0469562 [Tanacetum coccineum]
MDWKKKLSKANLEGPTFKVARPFHDNIISLQFQMEVCHLLLIDQANLVNPEGYRVVLDVRKPLPLRVLLMVSPTGGLSAKNSTSQDIVPPLIAVQSDNEYKISEADFKNLHPNDFEDLYLLHLQGQLNHLSGADKVHLFNAVNLWIRNIVIRKRVEDLQLGIESYHHTLYERAPRPLHTPTQPDHNRSIINTRQLSSYA